MTFPSPHGGDAPPPLTRRERREREEAAAREAAAHVPQAADSGGDTPPVSPRAPESDGGLEQPRVMPMDLPSSVVTPDPPQAPAPPMPPVPPTPPAPPVQTAQPLTRRQLREMEQKQQAETGTIPAPADPVADELGSTITAPPEPPETPVDRPTAPEEPAPLPPVFAPPVSASSVDVAPMSAPPVSAETGSFPIIPEEIPDVDTELAQSREVGSGSPTTHALILPTTPMMDITGPIGDTGEILVTGQIPLPRLVTERGVNRDLDRDDDESFDQIIEADSTPLTAPIRASRAVSTRDDERELQMVRRAPFGSTAALLGMSAVLLVAASGGLIAVAVLSGLLAWPF